MWAAEYGNTDIVTLLQEHGADVNHKDNDGQLHNIILLCNVSLVYSS